MRIFTIGYEGATQDEFVAALVKADIGIRGVQDSVSELEQIFLEFTRTEAVEPGNERPKVKA